MVHINRYIERPIFWVVLVGVIWLVGNPSTSALEINLERPGDREFVRDLVDMIDSAAEDHIKHLCNRLLNDKATPIIAITIGSMERYAGRGMRIETFTKLLFDQWQVGHSKLDHQDWNTGILLLVSRGDRQARIELGAGWGHKQDALCRQIMDNHIIYHFKQDRYSEGIVAGVEALDKMARKLELPIRTRPWWHYGLVIAFISLGIFTIVSLIRRGSSGWAWIFWAAIFALLGTFLYQTLSNRGRGGDGFSSGSFGGGFSGGGGATGSW